MRSSVVRRVVIAVGSIAGLWCVRELLFAAQTADWEGAPFQALFLIAGGCSVVGLVLALALQACRSSALSHALWRGASANAAVVAAASFALAVASYCGFVGLQDIVHAVREPSSVADQWRPYAKAAIALLALGPMFMSAVVVLAIAAWQLQRIRLDASPLRALALWAFCVPWILGVIAETGFRVAEQAVLKRHVDGPSVANAAALERWRSLAWPHAWPRLWKATDHDASTSAPPPDERARRARAAYEALTGFDFFAGSRARD